MTVLELEGVFVVARGKGKRTMYFSFFIDGDSSSWSKLKANARRFASVKAAQEAIEQLKHRARIRPPVSVPWPGRGEMKKKKTKRTRKEPTAPGADLYARLMAMMEVAATGVIAHMEHKAESSANWKRHTYEQTTLSKGCNSSVKVIVHQWWS